MPRGSQTTGRLERLEAIAEQVLWVALFAIAVGAAYLVYAVSSGDRYVVDFNRFPQADQLYIYDRLGVACQIVLYATYLALAALAIRSWRDLELGYAALLAGVLYQLAVPQILRFSLAEQGGAPSPASALIVAMFRQAGSVALIVGAILASRDLLERLTARRFHARVLASRATSPPRVRDLPLDRRDRFLGKCWELPMCRPAIRNSCPVFIRGKQPCWRIGVGCMCSEQVLLMAARTRGDDLTQAHEPTGVWQPQFVTLEQLASKLTPAQKRERCMSCAIYLHHQEQKYRAALPVVACAVVAGVAATLPLFHRAFVALANATDRLAGKVALQPGTAATLHPALKEWSGRLAEAYVAEWILFFCAGLVLLSYALLGLEYAITRRGW